MSLLETSIQFREAVEKLAPELGTEERVAFFREATGNAWIIWQSMQDQIRKAEEAALKARSCG